METPTLLPGHCQLRVQTNDSRRRRSVRHRQGHVLLFSLNINLKPGKCHFQPEDSGLNCEYEAPSQGIFPDQLAFVKSHLFTHMALQHIGPEASGLFPEAVEPAAYCTVLKTTSS